MSDNKLIRRIQDDVKEAILQILTVEAKLHVLYGFEGNSTSMSTHVRVSGRPFLAHQQAL